MTLGTLNKSGGSLEGQNSPLLFYYMQKVYDNDQECGVSVILEASRTYFGVKKDKVTNSYLNNCNTSWMTKMTLHTISY
jgi:hypothetical protein